MSADTSDAPRGAVGAGVTVASGDAAATTTGGRGRPRAVFESPWFAVVAFVAAAGLVFVVTVLSVHLLSFDTVPPQGYTQHRFFEGWTRWDTGWYFTIATHGYSYAGSAVQSSVAFFPAYPLAMRFADVVLPGDVLAAGVVVTYALGLASVVMFWAWARAGIRRDGVAVAVAFVVLWPCAFFLYGAVYSDALFLAAGLGSLLLLEHRRPWLAGLVGVVATASRPTGVAVTAALVLRALELRGVLGTGPPALVGALGGSRARFARLAPSLHLSRWSWHDLGVLLSLAGIGGYVAYLGARFSEPLAFMKVESAPGWNRHLTLDTVVKGDFFRLWAHPAARWDTIGLTIQFLLVVASLALLPSIARRFGWGYTAFVVIAVGLPVLSSREFLATGRYTLVAFPVMAAGADVLVGPGPGRRVLRWLVPAAFAVGLVWMASFWARWYLLT